MVFWFVALNLGYKSCDCLLTRSLMTAPFSVYRASCRLGSLKLSNTLVLFAEPPSVCRACQQLQDEGYLQTNAVGLLLAPGFTVSASAPT